VDDSTSTDSPNSSVAAINLNPAFQADLPPSYEAANANDEAGEKKTVLELTQKNSPDQELAPPTFEDAMNKQNLDSSKVASDEDAMHKQNLDSSKVASDEASTNKHNLKSDKVSNALEVNDA